MARKLVLGITKESLKLKANPKIGQEEELLTSYSLNFRYIIFKNDKIIYAVNLEEKSIKIFDVFDTRQNPVILKERNSIFMLKRKPQKP